MEGFQETLKTRYLSRLKRSSRSSVATQTGSSIAARVSQSNDMTEGVNNIR